MLYLLAMWRQSCYTLIKKKKKIFLIDKEIQNGAVAKSYLTIRPPRIWGNICAFPHLLGIPFSYKTLQLLHSEFPYI